ncbi:MAG: LamG domain-containing protein [Planctomycetales bacterium]|nr:LamG domain-containing protein [Planctomycetales bacterium]
MPGTESIGGMIVFRGQLYASSLYRPAGFFRYDGETRWIDCGTPDGKRVVALGVYDGFLYATSYDGGFVYRYDGTSWTDCGRLGENTQTYSFAVYQGRLYVGTWPSGRVYRFEDVGQWTDMGRLGEELEVMGMLVHNGRLIAGTLPLAEVYSYEGDTTWKRLTRLDHTPDVKYRRAWTMAEHDGRVFCSTLPSGKVFAFEAGRNVTCGKSLSAGWHHIGAVKSHDRLTLYVDGQRVAQSSPFDATQFDLDNRLPLQIGFGANDRLRGRMADLRLYRRTLQPNEIRQLAVQPK